MSDDFYLSFSGKSTAELKAAVMHNKQIDELELETFSKEIVEILIQAKVSIRTLILEESFIEAPLLSHLLASVSIEKLVFPGYDACEAECDYEDECEEVVDACRP